MRGKAAKRRELLPDDKYNSTTVSQLINKLIVGGQKTTAKNAVYRALEKAEKEIKQPAIDILEQAIKNASPLVEVRSKRVGGATYQVPVQVRSNRKTALAMRWIIESARNAKGPIDQKIARELMDAYKNEGTAIKKRNDVHRMAEANKAFAHYARF